MANDSTSKKVFGKLTFNDTLSVRLEYDHGTMTEFTERLAHAFIFKYNLAKTGTQVEIFSTITKNSIENGERVWGLMLVIEINKKQMSLDEFHQMISDSKDPILNDEPQVPIEKFAYTLHERINTALPNKIGLVLQQTIDELYAWASSTGGVVSKAEYDKVTHIPAFMITPAKKGGSTSRYIWTDQERAGLESHYRSLLTQIKQARRWYKRICKNEKRRVAYDLVKAKFSETLTMSDGMIRRLCYLHTRYRNPYKWRPSDIAIEYAARLCNFSSGSYRPFSLTARQLKGYLPKATKKTMKSIS